LEEDNHMAKKNAYNNRARRQDRARSPDLPKPRRTSRVIRPTKALEQLEQRTIERFGSDQIKTVGNTPGQEKMSKVLGNFIAPYTDLAQDLAAYERLVALAVVAWNAAIREGSERAQLLQAVLKTIGAEDQEDFLTFIDELIQRKERHFAQNRRSIIDCEVTEAEHGYYIAVVSTLARDDPYEVDRQGGPLHALVRTIASMWSAVRRRFRSDRS
jgi:hypothetical protein